MWAGVRRVTAPRRSADDGGPARFRRRHVVIVQSVVAKGDHRLAGGHPSGGRLRLFP